jgi:hypothetical protein
MNLASLGQVLLIWMLFFVTLGNCVTSKYKLLNVLSNLDESIIGFNVVPTMWDYVNRRRHSSCFWWKKLEY